MKNLILIFLFMTVMLISCEDNINDSLYKSKVVNILIDMHILAQGIDRKHEDFDSLYSEYWSIIERKHQISKEEFMAYFNKITLETQELDKIYDRVIDSLSQLENNQYELSEDVIKIK